MPSQIITVGLDSRTIAFLNENGLEVLAAEQGQLAQVVAQHPNAVILVEGAPMWDQVMSVWPETAESLKVIRIAREDEDQVDIGEAIRSHIFSVFHRPLDEDLFLESVEEARGLHSWSDGIEVLSARPHWLTLCVRSRRYTAERVVRFIREMVSDLTPDERESIGTSFREILLNGMEHGAAFNSSKRVYVSCLRTTHFIMYTVRDPGTGFSFGELPHAAISNPPDDPVRHVLHRAEHGIRAGGFGLMVARDLVDEMLHNEAGNEVVLIKYLAATRA